MTSIQKPTTNLPSTVRVDIQMNAADGEKSFRVDRKLKNAISRAIEPQKGGGRQISVAELVGAITKNIVDGGKYAASEKPLVRMLYAALDDRNSVTLNGVKVSITDPAEKALVHSMAVFFGGLPSKALKAMDGQTAQQVINAYAQATQQG